MANSLQIYVVCTDKFLFTLGYVTKVTYINKFYQVNG